MCLIIFLPLLRISITLFSAADARAAPGADMSISDGSSEISGVPKDREKKHDISNH